MSQPAISTPARELIGFICLCRPTKVFGGSLAASYHSEMSARNQTPLARLVKGLFAAFNFPTRPAIGGSHPDGESSPVSSRHARQPFSIRSTTGSTSIPATRAYRPFRRANPGQLWARRRATLLAVRRLSDSVSTTTSRITMRSCCEALLRLMTIFSFGMTC
jgi:hypothetical protein